MALCGRESGGYWGLIKYSRQSVCESAEGLKEYGGGSIGIGLLVSKAFVLMALVIRVDSVCLEFRCPGFCLVLASAFFLCFCLLGFMALHAI
jgi:hypothetical protein